MTEEYLELSTHLEFKEKLNDVLTRFSKRLYALEEENGSLKERVEVLETALLAKQPSTSSSKGKVTDEELLKAVAGSKGLKAASEKLNMTEADVKLRMEKYEKFKYFAELWSRAAKRALGLEVTPQRHPENIQERSVRSWAAVVKSKGLTETAKDAGVAANALGMYLHIEGFIVTSKMKPDDWKKAAKDFLEKNGDKIDS